ncbi:MAG: cytochrome c3 family protein, partial [Fidelibacterota bacterium]
MTTKVKKYSIFFGGFLFVILLVFAGAAEYTSKPRFCRTCHYMAPFYDGWATSKHNMVACTDCHYEPGLRSKFRAKVEGMLQVGKYVTNAYRKSKPWAEIPDASCLREGCHEERLLHGETKFKRVKFDHKPHLTFLRRGKKLRCTSCHSQIVQGDHITVTEATCFICHFKGEETEVKTSECTICHKPDYFIKHKDEFNFDHELVVKAKLDCLQCHANTIVGDGAVPRENCFSCHWEQDRLDRAGETDLMHKTHITDNKIECLQCHLSIQHKIVRKTLLTGEDCQTCHTGMHESEIKLFSGTGGYALNHIPNPMFEGGLNCRGCHIFHEQIRKPADGEHTYYARPESCDRCHGKGYERILKDWEEFADQRLKKLTREYARVVKEVTKSPVYTGKKRNEIDELLRQARYNMDIVNTGKSVHNVQYSDELLSYAHNLLEKALKIARSSYMLAQFEKSGEIVPSECSNCHYGIEEINARIFGLNYSHEKHLVVVGLTCKRCHSNLNTHGELVVSREECLNCHHTREDRKCQFCHDVQYTTFAGKPSVMPEPIPDVMFEAGLDCDSCHLNEAGKVYRPRGDKCLSCHEEGYDLMQAEWQQSIKELLQEIDDLTG